jgi:hypothetical protein
MEQNGFETLASVLTFILEGCTFIGFIVVCLAFLIGFGG